MINDFNDEYDNSNEFDNGVKILHSTKLYFLESGLLRNTVIHLFL